MLVLPKGTKPLIFVIGPMGAGKGRYGKVDSGDHIPNIGRALQKLQARFTAEGLPDFDFATPSDPKSHSINKFVLPAIDRCDIGIADLSGSSPNVFYELAFMHALGIPVILLNSSRRLDRLDYFWRPRNPIPWYVAPRAIIPIARFEPDVLEAELDTPIRALLTGKAVPAVFTNEISQIYDEIALVDISAASGLAAGHFFNFLYHMISAGGPLRPENLKTELNAHWSKFEPPEKIIVVKPNYIAGFDDMKKALTSKLPLTTIDFSPAGSDGSRPFKVHRYKSYIIDFPDPIKTLRKSHRYRARSNASKGDPTHDEIMQKMEHKWIEAYFASLKNYEKEEMNINDGKIEPKSPDEVLAL